MVKGEDRLKEKLADELFGKNKTVRQALNEVPDAVRFTLRYDSGRYADGVVADVDRLKVEGFRADQAQEPLGQQPIQGR